MRFTAAQYDEAIENLKLAKAQLASDGNPCEVCGCSSHMAFECGHNPLVAMEVCAATVEAATRCHDMVHAHEEVAEADRVPRPWPDILRVHLHHFLHWATGFDTAFGVQRGPAKVVRPAGKEAT